MRSTFSGLNTGYSALAANQRALDITGHNVANANTEGYTRQDIVLQPARAIKSIEGYVGTGVEIVEFRRIRDQFLDIQMRTENKALGEWDIKSNILGKLEVIFNEPSDTSLSTVLDNFWDSWQLLVKNPEGITGRTAVMQSGQNLANTLNELDQQFFELQSDINNSLQAKVGEINTYAHQIWDVNQQIIKAESGGQKANDLRDRRDLIVEKLAKIVNIDVVEEQFGAINVSIGGGFLVSPKTISEVKFIDHYADPSLAQIVWYDSLADEQRGNLNINGGEMKGYTDSRDDVITIYREKIAELAKVVAEEVNKQHQAGYGLEGSTGIDFFTMRDAGPDFSASNIRVNQEIIDNLNLLAAAGELNFDTSVDPPVLADPPVFAGDGANALLIAGIKNKMTMSGGVASFEDFYSSMVGQLGIQGQEANFLLENRTLLMEQLNNRRDAVSGVSLDEEMTNMIRFQHSYSAAARIINTMDEMLDLIINRLGLVGR